jgi:hypothetical protein
MIYCEICTNEFSGEDFATVRTAPWPKSRVDAGGARLRHARTPA